MSLFEVGIRRCYFISVVSTKIAWQIFLLLSVDMAVGKNKGLKIGGKKGAKKKIVDPFTRKDWWVIYSKSITDLQATKLFQKFETI